MVKEKQNTIKKSTTNVQFIKTVIIEKIIEEVNDLTQEDLESILEFIRGYKNAVKNK